MISAPIPANDAQRLLELHALELLDTPPEERFDRTTRLLSLVLRVPMAYLSLVDADRQWFKSSCGLSTSETPRAVSFCGHAILSDEAMVVPDALEDERFQDNPLVTGDPHIRFYAGQPLHGPGGQRVGTLCVADRQPRRLHPDELETLREMAHLVERELGLVEVAQLQRALLASQQHLAFELAQAAAYVQSLLPEPCDGPVRARWRFEPSSNLGGDFFGYDWIDPDHFGVYLLDVSGHGVGAALLSISVGNVLRARSLGGIDPREPAAVLAGLNDAFPMEQHGNKYFTIWYGVYNRRQRLLTHASGGHPPALLLSGAGPESRKALELGTENPLIGILPQVAFESRTVSVGPCNKLYIFSDGAYEIHRPGGPVMEQAELMEYLASSPGPAGLEDVWRFVQEASGGEPLKDDFSLLELHFA